MKKKFLFKNKVFEIQNKILIYIVFFILNTYNISGNIVSPNKENNFDFYYINKPETDRETAQKNTQLYLLMKKYNDFFHFLRTNNTVKRVINTLYKYYGKDIKNCKNIKVFNAQEIKEIINNLIISLELCPNQYRGSFVESLNNFINNLNGSQKNLENSLNKLMQNGEKEIYIIVVWALYITHFIKKIFDPNVLENKSIYYSFLNIPFRRMYVEKSWNNINFEKTIKNTFSEEFLITKNIIEDECLGLFISTQQGRDIISRRTLFVEMLQKNPRQKEKINLSLEKVKNLKQKTIPNLNYNFQGEAFIDSEIDVSKLEKILEGFVPEIDLDIAPSITPVIVKLFGKSSFLGKNAPLWTYGVWSFFKQHREIAMKYLINSLGHDDLENDLKKIDGYKASTIKEKTNSFLKYEFPLISSLLNWKKMSENEKNILNDKLNKIKEFNEIINDSEKLDLVIKNNIKVNQELKNYDINEIRKNFGNSIINNKYNLLREIDSKNYLSDTWGYAKRIVNNGGYYPSQNKFLQNFVNQKILSYLDMPILGLSYTGYALGIASKNAIQTGFSFISYKNMITAYVDMFKMYKIMYQYFNNLKQISLEVRVLVKEIKNLYDEAGIDFNTYALPEFINAFNTYKNKNDKKLLKKIENFGLDIFKSDTLNKMMTYPYLLTSVIMPGLIAKFYFKEIKDCSVITVTDNLIGTVDFSIIKTQLINNSDSKKNKFCLVELSKDTTQSVIEFENIWNPSIHHSSLNSLCLKDKQRNGCLVGPTGSGKSVILASVANGIYLSNTGICCAEKFVTPYYMLVMDHLKPDYIIGKDGLSKHLSERKSLEEILMVVKNIRNAFDKCSLFIIFDEIYSGTNPVDAVDMAAKDLKKLLLDTYSNVIITTHFPDLAKVTEIKENSMKLYYLIVEYNENTNKFINRFVLSDDSRYGWWIHNRELRKLYNSYLEQVGFDARKLN